ncbi:MAG: cation:dicarboxylase symporter family transporter [Treponema sp.]|jgi:Na+/H+-dicarboxylate symporter|nr:cation:dicarboxylase symporter family transporter [Treponema sp.]
MKHWIKLLTGSLLGVFLGFFLPQNIPELSAALTWLERLVISIGRYAVVPVLFFSLSISVYELRQDGKFWGLLLRSLLTMAAGAVFIISAGILAVFLFPPSRIQISNEEQIAAVSLGTLDSILEIFPSNMLAALTGGGVYLLPVCVFAVFLGIGLSGDRNQTKPVITLIDSLSHIFYYIVSVLSDVVALLFVILSAYWAVRYRAVLADGKFRDLILLLGGLSGVLGLAVMPLLLYALKPRMNPWAALYGSFGPALTAFFSGDVNFTLPVLMRHVKENLGVRRRANALTLSLFSVFGRAGSAMTAAVSLIVIISSYSSLEITRADILSIGIRACVISFLLFRHPGDGAYTALAVLCAGYSGEYKAGYLNLRPLAFFLTATGAFLDVMFASFASCAIARKSGLQEARHPRHFI